MSQLKLCSLKNRSLLRLSGEDVKSFLQNLITNDVDQLSENQSLYSALLTPQGKFLHDFILIQWGDHIFLDCLTERSADLIRRFTMYKLRADVTIEDVTNQHQVLAVFGKEEESQFPLPLTEGSIASGDDYLIYSDPRLADLGHRIIAKTDSRWREKYPTLNNVESGEYIQHRLSLGVPEGGLDIEPEKNFLLEVNFEELHGVSFSKGCYVGQELTARTKHRAKIKKRLLKFHFEGNLKIGDPISFAGKEIATVTSFERPYGLALTRLKDWNNMMNEQTHFTPDGLILSKPAYVEIPSEDT